MISSPDYSRDFPQLVALLDKIVFQRTEPQFTGEEALHLRNALADFSGNGIAAIKRKAELQDEQRKEGLFSVDVVVRDLQFWELHAFMPKASCPDMCADGEQVLTVYYAADEDEEGLYITLRHVTSAVPLVVRGEDRDLVIGAGADILPELFRDRQEEIKDKVWSAVRMMAGEMRAEMAEAA
jgi:hypothetical protein